MYIPTPCNTVPENEIKKSNLIAFAVPQQQAQRQREVLVFHGDAEQSELNSRSLALQMGFN